METAEKKRRFRPLKTAQALILGIVLCLAAGAPGWLAGRDGALEDRTVLDAVVLENQLSGISELASVTYSYTNMAQFKNSSEFYGMTVPFTTKSFILTYDGVIKAGVDLTGAEVRVSGTTVTVTLPKAEILSHEIDSDSVEIFDERTSIFNPFTVEDMTAFQADQKREMEARALDRGLLDQAAEKARDSVRALLSAALPEGYTLLVR